MKKMLLYSFLLSSSCSVFGILVLKNVGKPTTSRSVQQVSSKMYRSGKRTMTSKADGYSGDQLNSSDQDPTRISISVACHERMETIKEDVAKLKYYCEGTFSSIGKRNDPRDKPSDVINWLQQEPLTDENTQLEYVPASTYIKWFIQKHNDALDAVFAEKYEETRDVQATWQWFNDYFAENVLRKPISDYLQKMVNHDAERLEYAKKGIFFSKDGRTVIIDPSLAIKE